MTGLWLTPLLFPPSWPREQLTALKSADGKISLLEFAIKMLEDKVRARDRAGDGEVVTERVGLGVSRSAPAAGYPGAP